MDEKNNANAKAKPAASGVSEKAKPAVGGANEKVKTAANAPQWYTQFESLYKAGISHTFLFNFNVRDYVDSKRELERYVCDEFISPRKFAFTASYDISRGLTFPDAASEREFRKVALNGAPIPQANQPSRIFPLIELALNYTKFAIFINHVELLTPAGGTSSMSGEERAALVWLCEWSLSPRISAVGSLICLSASNIAAAAIELLSSSYKIEPIFIPLPDETERYEYIQAQLKQKPVSLSLSTQSFAALSSGLSKKSIRDIMLKSEAEDVPVSFEFIREKKHSVLQKEYGDVLEFIYPEISFENIGGMKAAKNYLMRNVIEPIRNNDLRRVPMGILLCGPSGTGKTLLVYALAKESGFNCVKIDMARILGQYVGESEKNFKKCLLGAQSQQPVIVFVDEIDTAFKRGDERDSGVSRNIFSEFLQFTGNTRNRGRVIFIAATNRPDLLDPALKRAGRFDKKIPILIPSSSERAEIFKTLIKKYKFETDIGDFSEFAEATAGYTGAELETVLRKAYEIACDERLKPAETDGSIATAGAGENANQSSISVAQSEDPACVSADATPLSITAVQSEVPACVSADATPSSVSADQSEIPALTSTDVTSSSIIVDQTEVLSDRPVTVDLHLAVDVRVGSAEKQYAPPAYATVEPSAGIPAIAPAAADQPPIEKQAVPADSAAATATAATVDTAETFIRAEHLSAAIEKCHPSTGQIEFMTKIAIDECDDDDLL